MDTQQKRTTETIRVLVVGASAGLYGADKALLGMVNGLKTTLDNVIEPIVLLPEHGPLEEELRKHKIQTIITPFAILRRSHSSISGIMTYTRELFTSIHKIRNIIKQEKIDIVHSNTFVILPAAIAARLSRKPHIWHIRELFTFKSTFVKNIFTRFILNNATHVIAVSNAVAAQFATTTSTARAAGTISANITTKVQVIYDGINVRHFSGFQPYEVNTSGSFIIGAVGRISYAKNHKLLLNAFIDVHKLFPNTRLVIMGDVFGTQDTMKQELEAIADNASMRDVIAFVPFQKDVREIMSSFDLYVMPSRYESFGIACLEAMAMRIPVIVSSAGGLPEIVDYGSAGLISQNENVEELKRNMIQLIQSKHLRKQLTSNAYERVSTLFSEEEATRRISKFYTRLVTHDHAK